MIPIAGGKFSKPRTPQYEEQEMEQAFRQVTRQAPARSSAPTGGESPQPRRSTAQETAQRRQRSAVVQRNKQITAIAMCAVAVVLLICIIVAVISISQPGSEAQDDGLILNNVTVAGVNIGGLTPEKAKEALHRATDLTYAQEDMVIQFPNGTLRLSPRDTGASLDIDAVVQAAFDYGRTGTDEENKRAQAQSLVGAHNIAVLPYLNLDREYIRQSLQEYLANFNSSYTDASYTFEGDIPALEGDYYDEKAPCQTLVLYLGTPGKHLDMEKIYNQILDAYSFNTFLVSVEGGQDGELPKALDLDAIFDKHTCEPIDAVMDMETFEVTPETYGYTFDLEEAKQLLAAAEYGDEIRIPMEYITPEVLAEDLEKILFRDVLGSCETPHSDDKDRTTNLKLACKAINGLVLKPGETFSFNEALGKRTEAAGYKPAPAYNGGETVKEVGGGICQVSTTLYYCTLIGDLSVTERIAHSYIPSYIDMGYDATVSWGGPDFKFVNNTNYPIRIEAEVSGNCVRIKILGTDEKDYYIRMENKVMDYEKPKTEYKELEEDNAEGYKDGDIIQSGTNGYTVYTYKCKYSKTTGTRISQDYEDISIYRSRSQIIAKIIVPETQPSEPSEPVESSEPIEETTSETP